MSVYCECDYPGTNAGLNVTIVNDTTLQLDIDWGTTTDYDCFNYTSYCTYAAATDSSFEIFNNATVPIYYQLTCIGGDTFNATDVNYNRTFYLFEYMNGWSLTTNSTDMTDYSDEICTLWYNSSAELHDDFSKTYFVDNATTTCGCEPIGAVTVNVTNDFWNYMYLQADEATGCGTYTSIDVNCTIESQINALPDYTLYCYNISDTYTYNDYEMVLGSDGKIYVLETTIGQCESVWSGSSIMLSSVVIVLAMALFSLIH